MRAILDTILTFFLRIHVATLPLKYERQLVDRLVLDLQGVGGWEGDNYHIWHKRLGWKIWIENKYYADMEIVKPETVHFRFLAARRLRVAAKSVIAQFCRNDARDIMQRLLKDNVPSS